MTTRNFSRAEADLQSAAQLIRGTADGWEADGEPNAFNLPLSSLRFNVGCTPRRVEKERPLHDRYTPRRVERCPDVTGGRVTVVARAT